MPVDYSLNSLTYDEILLGEIVGGGFGEANAYTSQAIDSNDSGGGPVSDNTAPVITLLGQSRIELSLGDAYIEDGESHR